MFRAELEVRLEITWNFIRVELLGIVGTGVECVHAYCSKERWYISERNVFVTVLQP